MSENGTKAGIHHQQCGDLLPRLPQKMEQKHRHHRLGNVHQEHREPGLLPERPGHIGAAGISGADLENVHTLGSGIKIAVGDVSEKIAHRQGDHNLLYAHIFSSPLSRMMKRRGVPTKPKASRT